MEKKHVLFEACLFPEVDIGALFQRLSLGILEWPKTDSKRVYDVFSGHEELKNVLSCNEREENIFFIIILNHLQRFSKHTCKYK